VVAIMLHFIVITGTRNPSPLLRQMVMELRVEIGTDWRGVVIHGGAKGADSFANSVFHKQSWVISAEPWPFGRETGPIRNAAIAGAVAELLRRGKTGRGYAFPDAKSRGTWDCIRRLRAVGLVVDERLVKPRKETAK
jgi:hypothetical protein